MYIHTARMKQLKSKIITQFMKESPLCIVIATIDFGMGIDYPDVPHVIHWGIPVDAEMYIQESDRGGRDGLLSCATILCNT